MPTPTYTALATVTVSTTTNTLTFSSIPAGYRDLVIQGATRSTRAAVTEDLLLRLNGDTGSNYTGVFMLASSGGAQSVTSSTTSFAVASNTVANTGTANVFSSFVGQVMDYSATDKHKTMLQRNGGGNQDQVWAGAGRFASTSAITSVTLFYAIGNIATGTTFSLYGIAS